MVTELCRDDRIIGTLQPASVPTTTIPRPLHPRLVDFGVAVCRAVRTVRRDTAGVNIARQLVRASMSPAASYAEAKGSESMQDFVHKLQICIKEMRETLVWLEAADRLGYTKPPRSAELRRECMELIAILVASVNTTKKRLAGSNSA